MKLNNLMSWLSALTFIFLIATVALFFSFKGDLKKENLECASFYNAPYHENNNLFYWAEGTSCCHYIIVEQVIVEECL